MSPECGLCGGACREADLAPLLDSRLDWLWKQIAEAADRRGDAGLAEGALEIRVPESPEARAAGVGFIGGRVLKPGQSRRLDLATLTLKLRGRGPYLTPGAVAAHATRQPLATRAKAKTARGNKEEQLWNLFVDLLGSLSERVVVKPNPDGVWPLLRRAGWIARLVSDDDPARLLRTAVVVLAALPRDGLRIDRRRFAAEVTRDPHALDEGKTLAGLVLAILAAAGKISGGKRPRAAWAEAGIDCDDMRGGLVAIGIAPEGWILPAGAVVTLPPRVLNACQWQRPEKQDAWVFVTENPSVASAATDLAATCANVRLLCTDGTPSAGEIDAIGRLTSVGWRVAVRADFDEAGLAHVAALLDGVPRSIPWRMDADAYRASVASPDNVNNSLDLKSLRDARWNIDLTAAMRESGIAAHEEVLLPLLLEDLRQGTPNCE
jgi:uncharacterized protein (TIGR02679 family)